MKRNIIKLLLAISLVLMLTIVCAAEETIKSGKCGDNVVWYMTEDNVLCVDGSGAMWDYAFFQCSISNVSLGKQVESVGEYTFALCDVNTLTIKNPAIKIHALAFRECNYISDVYYYGTPEQKIGVESYELARAPWHYMETTYTSNGNETHTVQDACTDCGKTPGKAVTEACTDENTDNLCDLCGAELRRITLAGANMTLGNDLKINFMIKKADMQDGYKAYVTQAGGAHMEVEIQSYNADYYAASYSVAAKEMTDVLSIAIYDADGNQVSKPFSRTVKQYAMTLLAAQSSSDQLKSVIVDMLNYGTEAQKYFGYNQTAYANADLTAAQMAYATGDVSCSNNQVAGKNFIGANLSLEDSILLNVFFRVPYTENLTAEVFFIDYKGDAVASDATVAKYGSMTKVIVDEIVLADARRPVTVTVYQNGAVAGECVESVESYIARNLSNSSTGAINMAIMKFAVSAYHYLGGSN